MSWLNFNESLNNFKGQISNLASGVLNDDSGDNEELSRTNAKIEELQNLCTSKDNEIFNLRRQNDEFLQKCAQMDRNVVPNVSTTSDENSWFWNVSEQSNNSPERQTGKDETISRLNEQLEKLENEKKDLIISLEQLDLDCQQTTDKLVTLKDSLQTDYNKLKENYEELSKKYEDLQTVRNKECKTLELELGRISKEKAVANEDTLKLKEEILGLENELRNVKNGAKNSSEEDNQKIFESNSVSSDIELENQNCHRMNSFDEKFQAETFSKYINIILEKVKKHLDCELPTSQDAPGESGEETEFQIQIENLIKLMLDYKWKTETLNKELCQMTEEKTKVVQEKNEDIEKLLKNSEMLSQEVIKQSQALKEFEAECSDLMKNNELLIAELESFKNNTSLQTIPESNEDNMVLLESQLDTSNRRIQDLELIIVDLENSKQETNVEMQTELDYIKKQLNMTGTELCQSKKDYGELYQRYQQLNDDNDVLRNEFIKLKYTYNICLGEKQELKTMLDKVKGDFENIEYKYEELNVNTESLKEDNENYKNFVEELKKSNGKLELENKELQVRIDLLENKFDAQTQEIIVEIEKCALKDDQIRGLIEKLQCAKMSETSLKLQNDTTNKELQNVAENKQHIEKELANLKIFTDQIEIEQQKKKEENSILQDKLFEFKDLEMEKVNMAVQNEELNAEILVLKEKLKDLEQQQELVVQNLESDNEIAALNSTVIEQAQKIDFLGSQLSELNASRNELINLITSKHQENVQYHEEIKRLSQYLTTETEKCHSLEMQLEKLASIDTAETDSIREEIEGKNQVIDKLTDQNAFLQEKCKVLTQNLLREQANLQQVLSEKSSSSEKEQLHQKELERLRQHLLEIEAMYTQELLQLEKRNEEMQMKVNEIEQREKNSSTIYTSVSIRTNQQVETLQSQLQLVTAQRDELRKKISDADDENNKQVAALTNLQMVLEQFQKDKEKDVYVETERIRRQIDVEKQIQQNLRIEIAGLKNQLEESKQGLQAAARLTDQLDKSKQQIGNLESEVARLQEITTKSEFKCKEMVTQQDSRVDKSLIKSLIIGFITSNTNINKDQMQILNIIGTVLDFNQQDNDKVKTNRQQASWLSSILSPHPSQDITQESLSLAFVKFLESESKPKVLPNLLDTDQAQKVEESEGPTRRQSPIVLNEVVLPTFADFGKSRNSSSILKDVLKDNC